MGWREYMWSLSDPERGQLLEAVLENEQDKGFSEYCYRDGDDECFYWEGSGEPIVEKFIREDWVIAEDGDFGRVFDADGDELFHVSRANMKTGYCESFQADESGHIKYGPIKETRYYSAPLRFEREER